MVLAASAGMGILSLAQRMLGHIIELGETDKTPCILAEDSSAAIAMSWKKGISKRNRRIEVRAMWLQHFIRTARVSLQKGSRKAELV